MRTRGKVDIPEEEVRNFARTWPDALKKITGGRRCFSKGRRRNGALRGAVKMNVSEYVRILRVKRRITSRRILRNGKKRRSGKRRTKDSGRRNSEIAPAGREKSDEEYIEWALETGDSDSPVWCDIERAFEKIENIINKK